MTKPLHIGLTTAIVIEILQAIKKGDRNRGGQLPFRCSQTRNA